MGKVIDKSDKLNLNWRDCRSSTAFPDTASQFQLACSELGYSRRPFCISGSPKSPLTSTCTHSALCRLVCYQSTPVAYKYKQRRARPFEGR